MLTYSATYANLGGKEKMSQRNDVETKSSETSRPRRTRKKIARPLRNIDAINKVVKVMYRYKTSVMYKDIAAACGMHPVNVSQTLSAARDVGLADLAGKKGLYNLTNEGKEYARLLTAGKEREARSLIGRLIRRNPLWVEVMRFLDATRGQPRDPLDLILEIERKAGKQWSRSTRAGLRESLVSILEFAEIIVKEGSKIIPVGEEQIEREGEAELPSIAISPPADREFATLKGDDFTFEIRKDLEALEFAESQFAAWVSYMRKKLVQEEKEARQSGGVPNQQQ